MWNIERSFDDQLCQKYSYQKALRLEILEDFSSKIFSVHTEHRFANTFTDKGPFPATSTNFPLPG